MAGTGIHPYHQQWPPAAVPPPPQPTAIPSPSSEEVTNFTSFINFHLLPIESIN